MDPTSKKEGHCDITAHTVLLYVLFCLTCMYCTLYHRHRYSVRTIACSLFPSAYIFALRHHMFWPDSHLFMYSYTSVHIASIVSIVWFWASCSSIRCAKCCRPASSDAQAAIDTFLASSNSWRSDTIDIVISFECSWRRVLSSWVVATDRSKTSNSWLRISNED